MILLAPAVLRLVGASVDSVPDGEAYRLLRLEPSGAPPRFEAPLVGREAQLARLEAVVAEAAATRRTRRVVLVGDP